ncbi:SDR family oxidoreductase [Virgibacillus sp. DJP39]|uniref:SDR family oxidoreductase n=1 Tax=Virgibacillus sp. DJP39 TaxID=3409790 RepID=UPI003BB5A124
MKNTFFVTGFPGFLATSLLQQLIHDHKKEIDQIHLLVLPSQCDQAIEQIKSLAHKHSVPEHFFSVITGDITKKDLDIPWETKTTLQESVTHVFHLAAIYDLAVPKDVAYDVNVNGTQNVNEWVMTLDKLIRYIYFSTAYVSGVREGKIYEHELNQGQTFKNHYEQTKYEAELLVNAIKDTVPTTIIRPGIVKGNSKTGETIKFDGIYFMLNLLDNLRFLPVVTYIGDGAPEGNFVPSDYVLNAVSYLALAPVGEGKTYHLTDPNPYKMNEIHKMLSERYLGKTPSGQIPLTIAKKAMSISIIRKWLQVEKEALDYFEIKSSYDCSQTVADLEGSDIVCPDFKDTLEPMIHFYRKYKHDYTKHIEIN